MATYSLAELSRSGIYQIVNTVNGKRYIGSAKSFTRRWRIHAWDLNRGKHHSRHLQAAWLKYGANAFRFEIIGLCDPVDLIAQEQAAFELHCPEYNIARKAGNTLGTKRTDESKLRISQSLKGKLLGRKHAPEHVAKRAALHRGMRRSEETRQRLSVAMSGKKRGPRSAEYRANLSKALKGRVMSAEHMAALQAGRASRIYTEEQRAAIAEKLRKSYEDGTRQREKTEEHKNKIGQFYAKLTDDQVREIRKLRAEGMQGKELARRFNSNGGTISAICNGKRYRWVPLE